MFGLFGTKRRGRTSKQGHKNAKVRAALAEHGDEGQAVRHVIHFAYPVEGGDAAAKQAARATILGLGSFDFTETEGSPGVVFDHQSEVASADFDALTDALETALARDGWKYDGWECAVATA